MILLSRFAELQINLKSHFMRFFYWALAHGFFWERNDI
jgi:hypothetical protein